MRQAGAKALRSSGRRRRTRPDIRGADIGGMVRLLRAAHSNLVLCFRDEHAADILERCIAEVVAHDPAAASADCAEDKMPAKLDLTTLVRMLVYVQAEIEQALRNARAARLLKQCIDHLLHQQYFQQQTGAGRTAMTSH